MKKEINTLTELKEPDKWSFDKTFLSEAIDKGKKILLSNTLSRNKRKSIKIDIETFERYLQDDYELEGSSYYKQSLPNNIDKLKEYILVRMAKQYKMLGERFIRWILDLSETRIFGGNSHFFGSTTTLSIEEQVELIMQNYVKNSSKFLEPAKKIILDKSVRQIQVTDYCDPYCHHDSITNNSFLIIDSSEVPCLFNHEVQHAIESLLKYPTNRLYWELGPIYYEMLFNEELYKSRGYIEERDFSFRIDDADYLLDSLHCYFKILLLFAEKNFDITTNEFLTTFQTIQNIKPSFLDDYLREEIAKDEKKMI